jgi:hypothetical protein
VVVALEAAVAVVALEVAAVAVVALEAAVVVALEAAVVVALEAIVASEADVVVDVDSEVTEVVAVAAEAVELPIQLVYALTEAESLTSKGRNGPSELIIA